MNSPLAINGGTPVRTKLYPAHNFIGSEEKEAVIKVLDSGNLSQFIGGWHADFFGGPEVKRLEQAWCDYTGAKHAVSVNSNTSGLCAAVGAAGVGPGDEVLVVPYTMVATATAIVTYNAIPVFVDIDPETFCMDTEDMKRKITPRTKAIMVVDLFGHPADIDTIMEVAGEHNLTVIEDAAQAPGGTYKGRNVGTLSHMTIFSLNYHKHIHCGEGGVVMTDDPDLALRLQLIRNHGEAVVGKIDVTELENTFGWNLRLTEISAAIGTAQLAKLDNLLAQRRENAHYLSEHLGEIPGITPPAIKHDSGHSFYVQAFLYDENEIGVSRDKFVQAVSAELPLPEDREWPLITAGYVTPIYQLPMYQKKIAYANGHYPFEGTDTNYDFGSCPVVEDINKKIIVTEFMRPPCDINDMKEVVQAFKKVYEHRNQL